MTDPRDLIKQATKIHESATPGPWRIVEANSELAIHPDGWCNRICATPVGEPDNATFIAIARTLVPELAAALTAERTVSDELIEEISDAKSLIRELRVHEAELTRELAEAK